METKLIAFLFLSTIIFFGWWYIQSKMFPRLADIDQKNRFPANIVAPAPLNRVDVIPASHPSTLAEERQIKVRTEHWWATISNRGAVITEWTMTSLPNGDPVDPPNGVNLISASLSQSVGAYFRFFIPSDPMLEKELNSARYEIKNIPGENLILNKGEKREISFSYSSNGIEASKTLVLKGEGYEGASGFDFDFQASVKRNGNAIAAYVVIGPNFGDQSVREVNTFKHAPQVMRQRK
jgi:YidC/Oxa1 family membrane protein insertase